MTIKNQYDLIREHERLNPDSFMFSKETLKFWGETKSRMKLADKATVTEYDGTEHECYTLITNRRDDMEGRPLQGVYYFDIETLERIIPGND